MKTITFQCETITPMFIAGADGQTPELRPPSIKGALRFWWRAMNGHLPLAELKKREGEIFGNTDHGSKIVLSVEKTNALKIKQEKPVHYKNYSLNAIDVKQQFDFVITLYKNAYFDEQKLVSLITLFLLFGGIGKRSRRGFGSFKIDKSNNSSFRKMPESYNEIISVFEKLDLNQYFYIGKNRNGQECIYSKFRRNEPYPYIKQIEIGRTQNGITSKTANTAYELKQDDFRKGTNNYGVSLGKATGGRFASPVFLSVIETIQGTAPIITTLNTVPKTLKHNISKPLQEEFKSNIL